MMLNQVQLGQKLLTKYSDYLFDKRMNGFVDSAGLRLLGYFENNRNENFTH